MQSCIANSTEPDRRENGFSNFSNRTPRRRAPILSLQTGLLVLLSSLLLAPAFTWAASLQGGRSGIVIVFRDKAAYEEAIAIINSGATKQNPLLTLPYVSCTVDSGTSVAVVPGGAWFSRQIVVTSGPRTGCRGVVSMEDVKQ